MTIFSFFHFSNLAWKYEDYIVQLNTHDLTAAGELYRDAEKDFTPDELLALLKLGDWDTDVYTPKQCMNSHRA